ncbi:MAG: hypothetical protein KDA90_02745 [Planctomycetaceae bacterium]|nr:hypothetical protein [Planctomycetaceae bacterium]
MNRKDQVTFEDILDEIMLQEPEPQYDALLRWCELYPEHRDQLTSFFATWAEQKERGERPVIDEDRVASKMVSHALNLIHHQTAPTTELRATTESRLHKMIRASGCSEQTLMDQCKLDDTLLAKLDRHLIVFASIPQRCIEGIAAALQFAVEDVSRVLMGDPIPLSSYKAKGKPVLRQESFLDAVTTSELSTPIKEEWRRIVTSETSH